ncbi:MAG: hypothetical protein LBH58_02635 [Tannerellaceae bacterium]|jgi:hypothetical protein|nr:hypothetical protein [Tannerellaceae bacterium]
MIIQINENIDLSRYDLNTPPDNWDSNLQSNQTEYANLRNMGPKNTEGFYFLYDNLETTKVVAAISCKKNRVSNYFITKTVTVSPIRVLDFSNCKCLHDMLDILDSLGINIYDSEMIIYGFENLKIKYLQYHNRNTRVLQGYPELLEVAWFGQQLTDYKNGKVFKELIVNSNIAIEGYRWCENHYPYGLTYCLFNCDKIAPPRRD